MISKEQLYMLALERDLYLRQLAYSLHRETVWTKDVINADEDNGEVDNWVRENY